MSDASKEGFEPSPLIYAGRREGTTGQVFIQFYLASNPSETVGFATPKLVRKFKTAIIGAIYSADRKGDSWLLGGYDKPSGDARIPEWVAADESLDVALQAERTMKKLREQSRDSILTALAPLRREYAQTNYIGKLALEVVLLHALRRGL